MAVEVVSVVWGLGLRLQRSVGLDLLRLLQ
jgi:hypothetical protein